MASKKKWIAFNFGEAITEKTKEKKTHPPRNGKSSQNSHINGKSSQKSQRKGKLDDDDAFLLNSFKKDFNFFKKIEPQSVEDLSVHTKKIIEVETWLDQFVLDSGPIKKPATSSLLLIAGPSGCGKSATVRVLCKQKGIGITEWINPINTTQQRDYNTEGYDNVGQATKFLEFLIQSKYPSLTCSCSKSICLVKDYPNTFLRSPREFERVLEEATSDPSLTVIFIATEVASSSLNIEKNLFPDLVKAKYNIGTITFNACAVTLMKNAIKRAQKLVQGHLDIFKMPSDDAIEAICGAAMGDIRCAINQFYVAALKGTGSVQLEIRKTTDATQTGAKRKRTTKHITLKNKLKDESLGLFHSIGRVLSAKIDPETNKIQCDLNSLIDEFSTQPTIFLSFLFENYLRHFGDITDTMSAGALLSTSQTFMDKWTDRHESLVIGLWIGVMGLMLNNKHKISKWNPIKGPVKVQKLNRKVNGTEFVSPTDYCYYNSIMKSDKFHKFVYK